MHMEYVVLLLNIFSYFMEMYDNLSTSKYVYITVLFLKSSSNIWKYVLKSYFVLKYAKYA